MPQRQLGLRFDPWPGNFHIPKVRKRERERGRERQRERHRERRRERKKERKKEREREKERKDGRKEGRKEGREGGKGEELKIEINPLINSSTESILHSNFSYMDIFL